MSLNVYLFFDGNCREVFEFYRSVFGGEFAMIQTFGEGPPEMNVPDSEKDRIMHVSLPVGSTVLMGSDSTSAFGPPPATGDNFAISVNAESREQCDDLCARMSEGGTVTSPPQEMFWGRLLRLLDRPVRNQVDGQLRAGKRVGRDPGEKCGLIPRLAAGIAEVRREPHEAPVAPRLALAVCLHG